MEFEIVYSAALERQGKGLSLSAMRGDSPLKAFQALDALTDEDVRDIYALGRRLGKGKKNLREKVRHAFRSTWL